MLNKKFRLGTRGSKLALWQTEWVRREIAASSPGVSVEIVIIKTTGDRNLGSPLSKIGDKGLFTKEIERALLDNRIDAAVHSLKDLPTTLPGGITIGAVTEREDVRDVFLPHPSNVRKSLSDQKGGAKIATGSLRRKAQIMNRWPSLEIINLRGNLETRFRKLTGSSWAGIVLAAAGVKRMGYSDRIGETIALDVILPAVGQGAVAVEIRSDDRSAASHLHGLHSPACAQATGAERALLKKLEGGCQVPIGAYGRLDLSGRLALDAVVGSLDGSRLVRGSMTGDPEDSVGIGTALADQLMRDGAEEILNEIRAQGETEDDLP